MKIAVAYEDGRIFQHFGHSENFKLYEIENGKVISSSVMSTEGSGHEALAGLLRGKGVHALICGGLGQGAADALSEAEIAVYSGNEGDADEAVSAFLRGELTNAGVNCDHHDHHEHHEETADGEGGCGGCGGGCGGCSGCGDAPMYFFEGKNVGKRVRVHYRGTFNDGSQFDSSYDRGEPLEFICGTGQMISGFDKAVAEMEVGDVVDVHLMPSEAYGERSDRMIVTVPVAQLPGAEELASGDRVHLTDELGRPFPAVVTAVDDTDITFDCNHEMAGKELNFRIELIEMN